MEQFRKKIRNIILEWYDDEYFAKPDQPGNFNPEDDSQVEELYTLLTVDGIQDIREVYPKWVINSLEQNGYIEEEQRSFSWMMTAEGLKVFPSFLELKKFLIQEGGFNKPNRQSQDDNESPYMRGHETDGG